MAAAGGFTCWSRKNRRREIVLKLHDLAGLHIHVVSIVGPRIKPCDRANYFAMVMPYRKSILKNGEIGPKSKSGNQNCPEQRGDFDPELLHEQLFLHARRRS